MTIALSRDTSQRRLMPTVLISGLGEAPGKTAVAVGLGRRWKNAGRSVGYVRTPESPDVHFVRKTLGVGESGDILLVEGTEYPDAKVLLVIGYRQGLQAPELSEHTVGIVVNGVPAKSLERVWRLFDGLPLLGLLPEERALMGFSVGDLARHLGAEYLVPPQGDGEIVEHLMLGANITDTATTYFIPKEHMAVFCRCDRPDLQLAALNQSVRCLVLTGTGFLQASVIHRAGDMSVPVLRVPDDTLDVLARLDGLVEGQRFRQEAKVLPMAALMERHFDFEALDTALGIA